MTIQNTVSDRVYRRLENYATASNTTVPKLMMRATIERVSGIRVSKAEQDFTRFLATRDSVTVRHEQWSYRPRWESYDRETARLRAAIHASRSDEPATAEAGRVLIAELMGLEFAPPYGEQKRPAPRGRERKNDAR